MLQALGKVALSIRVHHPNVVPVLGVAECPKTKDLLLVSMDNILYGRPSQSNHGNGCAVYVPDAALPDTEGHKFLCHFVLQQCCCPMQPEHPHMALLSAQVPFRFVWRYLQDTPKSRWSTCFDVQPTPLTSKCY